MRKYNSVDLMVFILVRNGNCSRLFAKVQAENPCQKEPFLLENEHPYNSKEKPDPKASH